MKPSIPKPAHVEAAFKAVERRLASVVKRINSEAARSMKAGDYETAKRWMESGKLVAEFGTRAGHFANEWRRLVRAARLVSPSTDESTGEKPTEKE